jgi:hypothetical protein
VFIHPLPSSKIQDVPYHLQGIIDGSALDSFGLSMMDETLKTSHMHPF